MSLLCYGLEESGRPPLKPQTKLCSSDSHQSSESIHTLHHFSPAEYSLFRLHGMKYYHTHTRTQIWALAQSVLLLSHKSRSAGAVLVLYRPNLALHPVFFLSGHTL